MRSKDEDLICPYCGHVTKGIYVDLCELTPTHFFEEECVKCEKIYGVDVEFEPYFYTEKIDEE